MKFLHISDIHFRRNYELDEFTSSFFKPKYYPEKQLEQLFLQIDMTTYDFVLITGDLVHEGEEEDYIQLKRLLADYLKGVPYFFCRGNHDIKEAFLNGMNVEGNEDNDYIACHQLNGLRIITLDSAQEGEHEGAISNRQFDTLKQYLVNPAPKGTILLLHHPLAWEEEAIQTKVPNEFVECIQKSDIIGIFVGHIHQNSVLPYGDTLQYMSEAISFGVDEYRDKSIFTNRTGYSTFTLTSNGLYRYNHLLTPSQAIVGGVIKPLSN